MKGLIIVIILAVIVVGGFLLFRGGDNQTGNQVTEPPPAESGGESSSSQASAVTVSYENNSFNPANLTLKVGDMVKFVNNHSFDIQIESNPHPIHTSMPDFSSDRIPPGGTFEFTFTAPVSVSFHNHLNPGAGGKIVVE